MNDSGFGTVADNPNNINVPHENMTADDNISRWTKLSRPHYSDEIPPLTNLLIA